MDFIMMLACSLSAGAIVGIIYGLLFAVLQTRVFLYRKNNRAILFAFMLVRTLSFFALHYVMCPILQNLSFILYGIFLFVFFFGTIFFYTYSKKPS